MPQPARARYPRAVAAILADWHAEQPGVDVSPVGVFGRITRIDRYLAAALRQVYRRHRLDSGEYDVLAALRRSPPGYQLTPTELYRSVLVTSATMTERLDRLQRRGLIARRPAARDRCSVLVGLTPAAARCSTAPTRACSPPKPPCSKAFPPKTGPPWPRSSPSSPATSNNIKEPRTAAHSYTSASPAGTSADRMRLPLQAPGPVMPMPMSARSSARSSQPPAPAHYVRPGQRSPTVDKTPGHPGQPGRLEPEQIIGTPLLPESVNKWGANIGDWRASHFPDCGSFRILDRKGWEIAGKYKTYSPEFRDEAARLVVETSRPIADVARELSISETSLGNWVRAYREKHAEDEPPLQLSERARLRELERQVRELEMENTFLKKAAAYFAREHR